MVTSRWRRNWSKKLQRKPRWSLRTKRLTKSPRSKRSVADELFPQIVHILIYIIIAMSEHQKMLEQIEKKMANLSNFKTEQEKKEKIFQYDLNQSDQAKKDESANQLNKQNFVITKLQAEMALEEIYNYYLNSYIQPRKNYKTFDVVNERKLTFQPFILFMKNFKLLKTIYSLERIKILFKKYANFGKFLTFQNFLFLIDEMSHQPEAKNHFNVGSDHGSVDIITAEELDRQELYLYMGLNDPEKYRKSFKPIFQPFNCQQKPQFSVKSYTYRKFSLPELIKKAVPKNKPEEKQLFVMKNRQIINENPFQKAKSIVVSWESLRSKSVATLQDTSGDIIRKKYIKQDEEEDEAYLHEYNQKQKAMRNKINQKIKELSEVERVKNKAILNRIEERQKKKVLKLGHPKK